ncbi:MAG: ParB/RepB/Spo0J family partition protein [Acidobacteriia bacterium]|nr:ParB/RepB/Spo0J family partition protein [Terriglobia bacterium]
MVRTPPQKTKSRKALGRGLGALLPKRSPSQSPADSRGRSRRDAVQSIPLGHINVNPTQPRRAFDPQAIEELAQSIRVDGVIQPIVVRQQQDRFQLVVGERRLRAARIAGIDEIPAIVKDVSDERLLQVALVENIQREDLNPIEVATALRTMAHDLDLSHEELAERTGKDRTSVTNQLRLLRLPEDIQQLVAERRLSMGHARAILSLDNVKQQRALAEKAAAQGLSVRQVERTARELNEPRKRAKQDTPLDPNVLAALDRLEEVLSTKVHLVERGRNGGKIEIEYYSADDLDRIYTTIVGKE